MYPTILVDITLKNITSARVNKTQEAQLGALVALILREPKSAVVFVSAEYATHLPITCVLYYTYAPVVLERVRICISSS